MRERLLTKGAETLTELEILEMLLFAGQPRGDTKPLAKILIRSLVCLPPFSEYPCSSCPMSVATVMRQSVR